ncbi:Constitutive coactivator of PPAR-gamma-like protein 1 [Acropora cervicornis]|uniref:Constitutive coactivator of PPAR-gamma-like protein 1 n=1 Tax=Acropora cervicornis TaxID=6130 RepID=A0AAD9R192_ACRCE|nr:Constitutive coactivator of PPAR-gamma-like protein 1 [Acropora cervicornis]
MMSNTPSMTQIVIVPKRLVILCCILRYMTAHGCIVLAPPELDAFLARVLSPHLTTECHASNLREIKLKRVDTRATRAVQLASIFMGGFDGKLFHSKYLLAVENACLIELCDGKAGRVEKFQRMKWCITEGLQADLSSPGLPANMVPRFPGQHGDGLLPTPVHFPFGPVPPAL